MGVMLACFAMVFAAFQVINFELASHHMFPAETAPWRMRANAQFWATAKAQHADAQGLLHATAQEHRSEGAAQVPSVSFL